MSFKVGDKVKFLDEPGGGKVIAIIDDKMVKIETDEGFEMPVLRNELILDYRNQPKTVDQPASAAAPREEQPAAASSWDDDPVSKISPWGTPREEEGIYLAFEPHDQQWYLTGPISVFLVNHTPYDILYSLFLDQSGKTEGVDYGSVPARSKKLLDTLSREDTESWSNGVIQLLIHEDQPEAIVLPVHTQLNIKTSRFFKEGSYQSNTLVEGKAIISVIALKHALQKANQNPGSGKFDQEAQKTKTTTQKKQSFIDQYRTSYGEAVVDLHIGEILDNIAGLSSSDIYQIQVNHFKKALDSAMASEYRKVTFIHGIGNGVLKNAIIDHFKEIGSERANIVKFGVGSLDVMIEAATE
jgi:hypothetical protein